MVIGLVWQIKADSAQHVAKGVLGIKLTVSINRVNNITLFLLCRLFWYFSNLQRRNQLLQRNKVAHIRGWLVNGNETINSCHNISRTGYHDYWSKLTKSIVKIHTTRSPILRSGSVWLKRVNPWSTIYKANRGHWHRDHPLCDLVQSA